MYVHRSNSAEALVAALERIVRTPVGRVTDAECIVVQGRGMERWLSTELSRRIGVWANPSFPFPRSIIDRAFDRVIGAEQNVFRPGALLWSIAKLLPQHLDAPAFDVLRHYLADDEDHRKRLQLAQRIADTFDGYAVYRPDMVLSWERGNSNDWQAILWRALVKATPSARHTAALAREFFRKVTRRSGPIDGFPRRVSLFGISSLPPLYMRVLAALAHRVDIHLFVLSPSREYWGDIRSSRQVLRSDRAAGMDSYEIDELLALPDGNPLLASMGRLHRDFQQVLEVCDDYVEPDGDLYRDAPATGTMLATLQADVLALRYRQPGNVDAPPLVLNAHDDSISVHACHGPMRELEVLHDRLVALFDADPTLQARDVVVMMPAVEDYAPLIDAVFGGENRDRPQIPYRISDRSVRANDAVLDTFARVLGILRGRLSAPDVLDILTLDLVRERFQISSDDLGPIRTWVADSGIRWGVDHDHRESVDQPALQENTWRFGLDRLLLGYAMPGDNRHVFHDVLPYDDVEGSATELLGRLIEFCETLFAFRETLQQRLTVAQWQRELQRLLDAMVAATETNVSEHQGLRDALATLADNAATAEFDAQVPLDSIRSLLESEWQSSGSVHSFLSGGVTFCQLTPMRSIPFRVVCLVGLNDGSFPRSARSLGFDLIAASPRVGDRSPRDDDRYLFLEAVLSAKDHLLITYVGQSIQNNRTLPPSVLLGELLDTIEESFVLPDADADANANANVGAAATVREHIIVRHPLQPFSPRHFSDRDEPELFSYSAAYCNAARSLAQPRRPSRPFLAKPLTLLDPANRTVTVDELARYFTAPAQVFTEQRIGLHLHERVDTIEDREPMRLDGLQTWHVGDQLLDRVLDDEPLDDALASVRGAGVIPLGTVGNITFTGLSTEATDIGAMSAPWREGGRLDGLTIDRQLGAMRITGTLTDLWPQAQLKTGYIRIGRRSEIGLWVRHLLLCWRAATGYPTCSVAVGRGDRSAPAAMKFTPVHEPQRHLRMLLQLFELGQTMPLPFFPEAARAYVGALQDTSKPDAERRALGVARTAFASKWGVNESADPYIGRLFGDTDPLDPNYRPFADVPDNYPSFADIARAVFEPLLAHRQAL